MFWMWGNPPAPISVPNIHKPSIPMYESGPSITSEVKLLQLRNLILQKELLVSRSNHDVSHLGEWQADYEFEINDKLNPLIDSLIKELLGE